VEELASQAPDKALEGPTLRRRGAEAEISSSLGLENEQGLTYYCPVQPHEGVGKSGGASERAVLTVEESTLLLLLLEEEGLLRRCPQPVSKGG